MFECSKEARGIFFMNNNQPPYSDHEIKEHILKIKKTMENNAEMILKYENAFDDHGLVENNKRIEPDKLSNSEKEAFEIYDGLQKSQSNLQVQLELFEAYLSDRGRQRSPSAKASHSHGQPK